MPGGGEVELSGFLDAKLPGSRCQRVRKCSLAPWKVWRRLWCSVVKLGPGLGIEIRLDHHGSSNETTTTNHLNTIKISSDSIISRTESRTKQFAFQILPTSEKKPLIYLSGTSETETQKWMANLRELLKPRKHRLLEGSFNVSLVDNSHSRAAGLSGVHGDLIVSRSGLFLKDVHTGDFIETFDWSEMNQFHLSTIGHDVKRICIIHTTKKFRNGIGELQLFCTNAENLLQILVTQGRGPKNKLKNNNSDKTKRPLSLSDGDLRLSIDNQDNNKELLKKINNKISFNMINNDGTDYLLTARSGSEVKLLNNLTDNNAIINKKNKLMSSSYLRAIDNDYQLEPAIVNNGLLFSNIDEFDRTSTERNSRVSIASGIYAEIIDNVDDDKCKKSSPWFKSRVYEDIEEFFMYKNQMPPPLPPRKRCGSNTTQNGSISDDGLDSESDNNIIQNYQNLKIEKINDESDYVPPDFIFVKNIVDDSDYVPMSPRIEKKNDETQEDIYIVMR